MKKCLAILLALALILCAGCGKTSPEPETQVSTETEAPTETEPTETQPPETTEPPTQPLPETEDAAVLADHVPAILAIFSRGDTLDVVGEYDESHYVVKLEQGYGLVEKQLLALPDAESYEVWTGYARWNARLYSNYRLSGVPIQSLTTNTRVEVLDDLGEVLVVKVGDLTGFLSADTVSRSVIQGGGSSGGSGGSSGGQDGGDISLGVSGGITLLSAISQEGDVTGQATVRADGTEVVLGFYDRDDIAKIVIETGFCEDWEGYCTVLLDDLYAHVPRNLVRTSGEEAYTPWDGYAKYSAQLYDNFYLQGEGTILPSNTAVHVLCDLGDCYLVTVNETTGYIAKDYVSLTRSSGGSGGSGGSSGGSEWSDPVL